MKRWSLKARSARSPVPPRSLAGRLIIISMFGLSSRPSEVGLKSYSTILIPQWMTRLADHRRCGELMARMPGEDVPVMAIVRGW
jgi:hypothetical protein